MDSVFRSDITQQETSFFLKNTFLLPVYLKEHKYHFLQKDVNKIINDVKSTSLTELINRDFNESIITESFMKRCFSKCKQFVLEDWIDYDELDCTMRCTLLHKKSFNVMRDVHHNQ